jgi:hypothetical protein
MSTLVVLKESDVLILGTDSRYMKPDGSTIGGNMKKIVEIAEQTFIAASGWLFAYDFEQAKARELASKLATTDIRIIGEALRREMIPYLKDLVASSYSVEGVHTYGGPGVCGNVPIHVSVLAGRDARGVLGFVLQEYALREGAVVIEPEPQEYFGSKRLMWARPGEPVIHIAQDPRTWTDDPVEVVRRFLTALKAANPRIGGPDQIIELDHCGAHWLSQLPESTARQVATGLAHASINVGGSGLTFSGSGGIVLANGGNILLSPGKVTAASFICHQIPVGTGAYYYEDEPGLYTTRVVKDASGNNKTVYIKGGIIVGWDV